ncbi:prolyl oligopeptidase family serine peptidase [Candidatus Microgenomates bacterium]|nr:prolyl oligopeptidase family serine peptidase [Candidatus Microgenomates bacterium]
MGKAKALTLLIVIVLVVQSLVPHFKALLLITEEFKQIPVKPLGLLTAKPEHEQITFETTSGKIIADTFVPPTRQVGNPGRPAIILVLGVKASEDDKKIIFHFQETMARLGYIVMWPRLEELDKGVGTIEEPETLAAAFRYLENMPQADTERISFVGFSVGSSIAFVASSDPTISYKVHSLIFFGGYFDIFEYLESLATKTGWQPHEGATNHITEVARTKKLETVLKYIETGGNFEIKEDDANLLKQINPREFVTDFKAPIFILHSRSDTYVPYQEAIKLRDALPESQVKKFHLANLFEHVQPKTGLSHETIVEFAKLYGFLVRVLQFL